MPADTFVKAIAADKQLRPGFWQHLENMARVISPLAFVSNTAPGTQGAKSLFAKQRECDQATAVHKAHQVLECLGVDTSTNWVGIFQRMLEPGVAEQVEETPGEIGRHSLPDLWDRTETVARLVCPGAFPSPGTQVVVHPKEIAEMFARKQKLLQAQAVMTAHQVLNYLGVNIDIDQYDLLGHMAENNWPVTTDE